MAELLGNEGNDFQVVVQQELRIRQIFHNEAVHHLYRVGGVLIEYAVLL